MSAKSKPQEVLSAAAVGGAAASMTTVRALGPPPPRGESRRIEGDGNAAAAIVERFGPQPVATPAHAGAAATAKPAA